MELGEYSLTSGEFSLGARRLTDGRVSFRVWAARHERVDLELVEPQKRCIPMRKCERGYFEAVLEDVAPSSLYRYVLEGELTRPDPASRFQPRGVHGPSQLVETGSMVWTDQDWKGLPLADYIIYELHVGTFTERGTFDAVIPHLDELKQLGITAVELMPVAQFPGSRNWGYDGVYPFAVQDSYGGPEALNRLVNACHERGLAVVLDVVYNHLGPEGNYLADFSPYFTDRYRTPWGSAINFDGPRSDEVVRFFIENALYWLNEFHVDALRLDAIHGIADRNAHPFLELLARAVKALRHRTGRNMYVIPESDLNDVRFIEPFEKGGYGLDAQWSDDLHHALHALLTGERSGYYQDFGKFDHLVKALREGFVYSGQYSAYRQRRHGNCSQAIPANRFVVFAQNHDQVGNRMMGDRLSTLVPFDTLKLAAGVVLLSPFIPLLFMGEEYGEEAPFYFFSSFEDLGLVNAVRVGRREEFKRFGWKGEPPDPQAESTFLASKLRRDLAVSGHHSVLMQYYAQLIALRNGCRPLAWLDKKTMELEVHEKERLLLMRRWLQDDEVIVIFGFADRSVECPLAIPGGRWRKLLDSSEACWHGGGSCVPDHLESGGLTTLEVPASAVVVFGRER